MTKDKINKVLQDYIDNYELDSISKSHLERFAGFMMGEFQGDGKRCGVCEASLKAYWHKLTPLLVNSLIKMRTRVLEKGVNRIHLRNDLNLSKSEYNNFQKLRFHGLIAHCEKNGEREEGYWLLTRRSSDFLKGEQKIPMRVKTFRNRVIEHDKRFTSVSEVIGSTPFLEDNNTILFDFMTL